MQTNPEENPSNLMFIRHIARSSPPWENDPANHGNHGRQGTGLISKAIRWYLDPDSLGIKPSKKTSFFSFKKPCAQTSFEVCAHFPLDQKAWLFSRKSRLTALWARNLFSLAKKKYLNSPVIHKSASTLEPQRGWGCFRHLERQSPPLPKAVI